MTLKMLHSEFPYILGKFDFFLSVYLFGDGLDDGSGGLYGGARYRHGLLDEIVRHWDGAP
jgi:hypothetical protein